MSYETLERVWQFSEAKGADLLVLLSLASHENKQGFSWPSISRLAKRTRLSARQVYKSIQNLEKSGDLAVGHAGERNRSNYYCVLSGLDDHEKSLIKIRINQLDDRPMGIIHGEGDMPVGDEQQTGGMNNEQGVRDEQQTGGMNSGSVRGESRTLTPVQDSPESLIKVKEYKEKENSRAEKEPPDVELIWQTLLDHLLANGQRALVESWLNGCEPEKLSGDVFLVRTRNSETSRFLDSRYSALINRALPGLLGRPTSVRFVSGGVQ